MANGNNQIAHAHILALGGFIYYGQSSRGSLFALLLFANLCLPILMTQVGNKLQHSLLSSKFSPQVERFRIVVYRSFHIAIELGYSLAGLFVLWFFITASHLGAASGLALLLVLANLYLRLNLRRKEHASKPLLWLRHLICLSITLGVLPYIV